MIPRGPSAGARIPHPAAPPRPSVPGLLMHFDGNFVDECRWRNFVLSGGVAADSIGAPAKFGTGSLSTGISVPATSTAYAVDFDFQSGAFTIEYFVYRLTSAEVIGPLVMYSSDSDAGSLIWQVRHTWGEGFSIPVFRHASEFAIATADNAAFYSVGAWDHIAIVSGADASTLRTYRNGILVATKPRYAMPSTPSGVLTIYGNDAAMIDDLRVLPTEVYVGSSFTPPTAPLSPTPSIA